jgi:hypothetical protein
MRKRAMNSTRQPSQRGARVLVGLIGGMVSLLGALAVWNLLVLAEAFAQESGTPAGEMAPTETAPTETVPTEVAPTETVPTQPAPTEATPQESVQKETAPTEAAPKPKQEVTLAGLWPDITGLVMQPVYLAVKVPVATVGAIVGACVWPFSGDMAEKTWDATVKDPWGWPDFVRRFGAQSRPPQ